MNQNKLLTKLSPLFMFFLCTLIGVSCKDKKEKNEKKNNKSVHNVEYIFISKPTKNDIVKYNDGIWNLQNISIISLKKRDTAVRKVNFERLLLNDKGFVEQKSKILVGERLKVNANLFNFKSLDSLNGNYAIKFMTKDSMLISSGPVIKIIDKNVALKELVHIEILLLKSN
ncbi:hypothetical protein ACQWU4_09645 [Chryseobacterium sp. MIQD13]|uniref:hypothetical protein n=1 Tax=Chryseobacterium sp. MIQD13 TaxID=3422310 RepID=UPI003D2988B6